MSTRLLAVIPFFLFYFRRVGGGSLVSFFPCVCVATEERQGKWGSRCRERATRAELNLCSILNRYHQMYHSSPPVRPLRVVCGCENRNSRRHQLFAAIYVSLFPSRPSAHQSIPIYTFYGNLEDQTWRHLFPIDLSDALLRRFYFNMHLTHLSFMSRHGPLLFSTTSRRKARYYTLKPLPGKPRAGI